MTSTKVSVGLYDDGRYTTAAVRLAPITQFWPVLVLVENMYKAARGYFRDFKVKKVRGCETIGPRYLIISTDRRPWVKI